MCIVPNVCIEASATHPTLMKIFAKKFCLKSYSLLHVPNRPDWIQS